MPDEAWVGAWQLPGGRRTHHHLIRGDRTACGRIVPGYARVYGWDGGVVTCLNCVPSREDGANPALPSQPTAVSRTGVSRKRGADPRASVGPES